MSAFSALRRAFKALMPSTPACSTSSRAMMRSFVACRSLTVAARLTCFRASCWTCCVDAWGRAGGGNKRWWWWWGGGSRRRHGVVRHKYEPALERKGRSSQHRLHIKHFHKLTDTLLQRPKHTLSTHPPTHPPVHESPAPLESAWGRAC